MITARAVDQAYSDHHETCGGIKEDYFGLLYLEQEHKMPREAALNQIAFGARDYGCDGFYFDEQRRNLYLYQFKFSSSYSQFKASFQRLIGDGMERIFAAPNRDDSKNQMLLQLRSCLVENRSFIDQVCIRFVFTGDPLDAERSSVLDKLREDLENKKYLVDRFFTGRDVGLVVQFRSSTGRIGSVDETPPTAVFEVAMSTQLCVEGPNSEMMIIGLLPLLELPQMHRELKSRFFDNNIRYGLGENEAVNRAISKALRQIAVDGSESPSVFAFNHNGITLYAERVESRDGHMRLVAPRLLNGAQTVATLTKFLEQNKDNPKLKEGLTRLQEARVLCRVITNADQKFVTRVTINNNRQNPVEPWNLHATDMIQLELQDKVKQDLGIYYERQENAFDQLSPEDLEDYGIREDFRAIQMLKVTQTFLLTDGAISRLSEMRRVFEDDKAYEQVFRQGRLKADSRHILLCYKVQYRLRKLTADIEQRGQNKYWFISRSRYLLWALVCQGLLNHPDLENLADAHGTSMLLPADFTQILSQLATTRVRVLLSKLLQDRDYAPKVADGKLSFLRTDRAFEKCMELAHREWRWVHKKLG